MEDNRRSLWLATGLWFHFWLSFWTLFCSTMAFIFVILQPRGTLARKVSHLWGEWILKFLGIELRVEGLEHLVPGQSYVYAANHRSQFDIFTLLAALPLDFGWVAKKSLFNIPIFGQALFRMGNIPIDRSNLQQAVKSLNVAAAIVRGGRSVVIFPEGTRAAGRELLPFKKGGFVMVMKAGQPIVPVSINGTMAIQPKGTITVRPGPIKVIISKPIHPQDFRGRRKEELIAAVRRDIARNFDPDYPYGTLGNRS